MICVLYVRTYRYYLSFEPLHVRLSSDSDMVAYPKSNSFISVVYRNNTSGPGVR